MRRMCKMPTVAISKAMIKMVLSIVRQGFGLSEAAAKPAILSADTETLFVAVKH